ncbi:hypothetical protein [Chitinophaga sp. sic0106]|uniref:hypothetical protein n=1 Tax=Chitinophaga sp. sic0106 TaxID=2854785 RepID=UPI001C481321|nr:hypothetical protein [Chitinophaga sp. sic0106]MBV7531425.1 hypothetical protein [Chitinophaga sp. sic0106]
MSSARTASVTIIATNSTNAGDITFSTFSFLKDGSLYPDSLPPVIVPTLADGDKATILQVYSPPSYGTPNKADCKGTAIFNLPTGPQLTITYNLSGLNGGPMPSIVPGQGYYVEGATTPVVDGYNYTFTITIRSN